MRNCCAANRFSGCCEGGECTSYSARAEEINRKIRTVQAKQTAYPVLTVFTFGLLLAASVFAGLTLDKHFKRQALIEQEQIAWTR